MRAALLLLLLAGCGGGVVTVEDVCSPGICCDGATAEVIHGQHRACVYLSDDGVGVYCAEFFATTEPCDQVGRDWQIGQCKGGRP